MSTWVYIRSEPNLWTVGFYDPDGKWHPDSDFDNTEKAADRVHYLNGGFPSMAEVTAEYFKKRETGTDFGDYQQQL